MKTAVAVPFGSSRALSPMQRGLLASQLKHPDAPVQNMPLLSHLADAIDARRLAEAFDSVVAASDALRTTVDRRSGAVTLIDADHLPPTAIVRLPKAEVEAWARARGRAPLDVSVCGYDSAIAVHEDETASWYLDLHHVITDATSSALVFEATAAAYFGELPGPSANGDDRAERSYYGWARKLAANLARPADRQTERAIDHWERRAPAPRVGRLYRAIDHPTPTAERIPLDLRSDLLGQTTARLAGDYRMLTEDLAWSTLLVTATALYCHRLTGTDRFAIGLPVHNRSDPAVRRLIGPTMEVFPVDIEIEPDDTFRTLHKRVGRSILDTLRHAAPGTSPSPDYEMVVNVIPRAVQQQFGSIPATTRWLHSGAIDGSHLLRVQMTSYAAGADTDPADHEFALDLNHGAADAEHRARAAGHYLAVLSDLVTDPDRPIGAATLCDQRELAELRRWESGPEPPTSGEPVVERLRRALADSTEVVVEDGERHITGRELWQWIAATASWLAERGVGPGRRVGLDLPRSAEAVTAIMAVMAAGASFVPLDPSQPKARRKRLATMADCVVVLSSIDDIAARRPDPAAPSRRFEPVVTSRMFTKSDTRRPWLRMASSCRRSTTAS